MIFFVDFMYAFLPTVFIFFYMFSYVCSSEDRKRVLTLVNVIFISILIGAIIQKIAIYTLYDAQAILFFRILVLFSLLIFFLALVLKRNLYYSYLFLAFSFASSSMAEYLNSIKDFALSAAGIVNSDLIIHISFILLASLLCIFFAFSIVKLTQKIYNKFIYYSMFVIALALYVLNLIAQIMLYAIKNDIIELTSARLSFVAKITYFSFLDAYLFMAFLAILVLFYFLHKTKMQNLESLIERRKIKKHILLENRWIRSSLFFALLTAGTLAYYDLIASQPPKRSDSILLKPNEDNNFVIDIEKVQDGDLHRFAYITQDGKKVRFFAINRYPDREKVVAVFDACMICGDEGYLKQDNQLICIACNVRIFIPSVGKPGGCNPIPLKYTKKDGKLYIKKDDVVAGATYFSEIVSIEVEDIISKERFLNTDTDYTYDFYGKTFYFKTEENLDKFRANPEKYAKDIVKRKWRVEGHDYGEEK